MQMSNRPEAGETDPRDLNTTPEFQAHVAKKLTALIDSSFLETESWRTTRDPSTKEEGAGDGIKLLQESRSSLCLNVRKSSPTKPVKRRKHDSSSSSDSSSEDEARFACVAVSGEAVLAQGALHNVSDSSRLTEDPHNGDKNDSSTISSDSSHKSISASKHSQCQQASVKNVEEKKKKKKKKKRKKENHMVT